MIGKLFSALLSAAIAFSSAAPAYAMGSTPASVLSQYSVDDTILDQITASNLKFAVHFRDLAGNWSVQTYTLNRNTIASITQDEDDAYFAYGTISSNCYPAGYVTYYGIYTGQANAAPLYDAFPSSSDDGLQHMGGSLTFTIKADRYGNWKWQWGSGDDYWVSAIPDYQALKHTTLQFTSASTGKTYTTTILENSYTGVSYNDTGCYGDPVRLKISLNTEIYEKYLSTLTGSTVKIQTTGASQTEQTITLNPNGSFWAVENGTTISFSESASSQSPDQSTETVTMYRLYNPNSGEHFYTGDKNEQETLVKLGWTDEGTGWISPKSSSQPVYRLYNPNAGDHHYTLDLNERNVLISLGWNDEGVGWYSDTGKTVPIYRQYNPNASAGSHNFTANLKERDDLVARGWHDEGISWYALQ